MARRGLIAALACLLAPAAAAAQARTAITGLATAFIGVVAGGDAADAGWTPGGAVTVIEVNGLGAEVDVSHAREFDNDRFVESGITTLTFNAAAVWSDPVARVRPYVVAGLGLIRVRACVADCRLATSRTDLGFDAGAGVFVVRDEFVGIRGDVRYYRYLQRHEDLPLTDSGFFDFWRATVGITFSWPFQ